MGDLTPINHPPQPPRAVCGDPSRPGVGVRLTPARRAFLEAATVHPVLRLARGGFDCASVTISHSSGCTLAEAGLIEPIMQGDFAAEEWSGDRLLGYRYRLTEAGRAAVQRE